MRRGVAWRRGVVLALVSVLAVVVGASGQDEEGRSSPSPEPFTAPASDQLQEAVDRLPELIGEDDREGLRALLGLPDAFTIAFEPRANGSINRREQWFYYDLSAVFEIIDGVILWNLPLDGETGFLLNAARHDPADFEDWMEWPSVRAKLPNPFSFEEVVLDDEYGVAANIYVGDQLVFAFDDEGKLFYVEAVPLTSTEVS